MRAAAWLLLAASAAAACGNVTGLVSGGSPTPPASPSATASLTPTPTVSDTPPCATPPPVGPPSNLVPWGTVGYLTVRPNADRDLLLGCAADTADGDCNGHRFTWVCTSDGLGAAHEEVWWIDLSAGDGDGNQLLQQYSPNPWVGPCCSF